MEPSDMDKDTSHIQTTIIVLFFSEIPDTTEMPKTINIACQIIKGSRLLNKASLIVGCILRYSKLPVKYMYASLATIPIAVAM